MNVRFEDGTNLEAVETDARFDGSLPTEVVRAFRRRMQQIRAAPDERTFYQLKSMHFEKLKGREGERSMKLNDQWRLIVRLNEIDGVKTVVVLGIEDYH